MTKYLVMVGSHSLSDVGPGSMYPTLQDFLVEVDNVEELFTEEMVKEAYEVNVKCGEYNDTLEKWFAEEVEYVGEFEPGSWWDGYSYAN